MHCEKHQRFGNGDGKNKATARDSSWEDFEKKKKKKDAIHPHT